MSGIDVIVDKDKCPVCKRPDLKRLVELGWNAKMTADSIASAFPGSILTKATISKHLAEHAEDASVHAIAVENAKPMRERVTALQRTLVDEVERRIESAQERAAWWNTHMNNVEGFEPRDWSYYYDVLAKDNQAAISSIVKMQGLTEKREMGKAAIGADIAKIMLGTGGGYAPKALSAGDDEVEGQVKDVTPDG